MDKNSERTIKRSNRGIIMSKEILKQTIESHIDEYMDIVNYLYENPEIGNQEFKAMEKLSSALESYGFDVTKGYVVPTGFKAEYDTHKEGPTIAFLCEYDALPEVGHGCGHNLIAGIGVAAGHAFKQIIDQYGGKVYVLGTPAEENFGGKVEFAKAGAFDDVDVALMVHPGTKNGVGGKSQAINPIKFEFFGKNAHGCHPEDGASALDAAVMTYVQINLLRQFIKPGCFIHGIIKDGGAAANVIPAYASLEYYFRAPTMDYAKEITEKAINCAKGACLATNTTFKTSVYECPYEDTLINYTLADLLMETYKEQGIEEVDPVDEVPAGSTDVGACSYKCPTIQGNIKIASDDVTGHSKEMACATISEAGKNGLIQASLAISTVALKLLENKDLLQKVKDEFNEATK